MRGFVRHIGAACLFALQGACATVDPTHDYLNAADRIGSATGVSNAYGPDGDGVSEAIERLLADGITADEAVQISLLNNPGLQAAFMDIGIARSDLVQAGLFSNPFVGLSARFPDAGGLANLEASVAQNIAELWLIPVRRGAAQRELDQAVLNLARKAAVLAAECKAAYYDAVGEAERLSITRENLAIAQNLLDMALTRQKAGAATELDVNLSRSLAIDAELAVESARLAASDARRRLAQLLGIEADAERLQLADPLPRLPANVPEPEALVSAAKAWRLDIRSARQAVSAAEWRLKEQYRLILPTVEIGIALERDERRPSSGRNILADTTRASIANGGLTAPEIEPRSTLSDAEEQNIIIGPSLGVELPIFDQNQAQIAKAQYVYEQSVKTLDAFERAATQEVRGAVDRAVTAWRVAGMYRDRSLPLAESNLDLSRQAYLAGQVSFLSVLEAQRFFLESRRGYIEAALAAAIAIPELERVIGLPFDKLFGPIPAPPDTDAVDNREKESSP